MPRASPGYEEDSCPSQEQEVEQAGQGEYGVSLPEGSGPWRRTGQVVRGLDLEINMCTVQFLVGIHAGGGLEYRGWVKTALIVFQTPGCTTGYLPLGGEP